MLRFLLNLSITPLPAEEWNKFMLSFLLNWSITPLPAEELNELYAAFLNEFVYYSLTSWRIKWTLCWVSCLIMHVCRLRSRKRLMSNFISKVVSCVSSPLPMIGVKFRKNLWLVFSCKVGWSLLCNVFYVMSCLFHINCATWSIV